MANINFEIFLGNISFVILFLIMMFYWVQSIFSIIPKFNFVIFFITLLSNLILFTLLLLRWVNYHHFPLSNLYESLIFLSWSFTLIQLIFIPSVSLNYIQILFKENLKILNFTNSKKINLNQSYPPVFSDSLFITQFKQKLNEPEFLVETSGTGVNSSFLNTKTVKENKLINTNINTIIGAVLSPIALFTNSFATFSLPKNMQKAQALVPALQSNWLMMHVSVMMLSYTALLCGSLLAITFLIITWYGSKNNCVTSDNLKLRSSNNFHISNEELPIKKLANTLDNLSYRILGIGFPLLTIGILSGAVWANEAWGSYWSWDPKETWAFITWLIFAIYLHTRITKGWEGKKPAILASFGFFIVWICYLGVNILGTGLHSYGWMQFS